MNTKKVILFIPGYILLGFILFCLARYSVETTHKINSTTLCPIVTMSTCPNVTIMPCQNTTTTTLSQPQITELYEKKKKNKKYILLWEV